jgi:tRNA G18 (ribose-2'-O)-methylase SpoU
MVTAILHNIRSIHNVGSMFRTADGVGIDKLYLTGHTPKPIDRFGRKRQKFSKVALGAEEIVDWEHKEDVLDLVNTLQESNWSVLACEPTQSAINVSGYAHELEDVCLVFGNEVDGLQSEVITACDETIQIPMHGKKTSLNVAVAFGILSYEVIDKKILKKVL